MNIKTVEKNKKDVKRNRSVNISDVLVRPTFKGSRFLEERKTKGGKEFTYRLPVYGKKYYRHHTDRCVGFQPPHKFQ